MIIGIIWIAFLRINRSQHVCIFLIPVVGPDLQQSITTSLISQVFGVKDIPIRHVWGTRALSNNSSVIICSTSLSRWEQYFLLHSSPLIYAPELLQRAAPCMQHCWGLTLMAEKIQVFQQWLTCHVWPWRAPGNCSYPQCKSLPRSSSWRQGFSQLWQNQHSAASLSSVMIFNTQCSIYLPGETSKEKASFPVQLCIRTWMAAFLEM